MAFIQGVAGGDDCSTVGCVCQSCPVVSSAGAGAGTFTGEQPEFHPRPDGGARLGELRRQPYDTATNQAWTNQFATLASNVAVDVPACQITFHWFATLEGKTFQDFDLTLAFRTTRKVLVVNREQEMRGQVAGDHPSWVATISPPIWVVTMTTTSNNHVLDFTNQDVAERVSRAIDHVMDLCGAPKEGF